MTVAQPLKPNAKAPAHLSAQRQGSQFRNMYRSTKMLARACRPLIKNAVVTIHGQKHLKMEAWQAIASLHELFVSTNQTEAIYNPDQSLRGFQATAAVRNSKGLLLATAQGFLSADEFAKPHSIPEALLRAQTQNRAVTRVCRILFAHLLPFIDKHLSSAPAEEVVLLNRSLADQKDSSTQNTLNQVMEALFLPNKASVSASEPKGP